MTSPANRLMVAVAEYCWARGYRLPRWRAPAEWTGDGGIGAMLHALTDGCELRAVLDNPASPEHDALRQALACVGCWALPGDGCAHFFREDHPGPVYHFGGACRRSSTVTLDLFPSPPT